MSKIYVFSIKKCLKRKKNEFFSNDILDDITKLYRLKKKSKNFRIVKYRIFWPLFGPKRYFFDLLIVSYRNIEISR